MNELEKYFIDEDELKENMAKGWNQTETIKTDNINPPPTTRVKNGKKSNLSNKKAVSSPLSSTEYDKRNPPIEYYFDSIPARITNESRSIRLSSDLLSCLKTVSFFMMQKGKNQSLKSYIENILIQHLKDYENEITDLEKTAHFTKIG